MTHDGHQGTVARLNVSQAAKAVRKARSTLNRDISNGKVSVTRNAKGQPFIEVAELERVYGVVDIRTLSDDGSEGQSRTDKKDSSDSMLRVEIEFLREKLATADRVQERERHQLQETIEDLRRRLDTEAEERRRLTALLTDQRPRAATQKPAEGGSGFWRWLRRSNS